MNRYDDFVNVSAVAMVFVTAVEAEVTLTTSLLAGDVTTTQSLRVCCAVLIKSFTIVV